jgi:predicted P-loop ATPase/GTPase
MIKFAKNILPEDIGKTYEILKIVSSGTKLKLIKCCWGLDSWYSFRLILTRITNNDLLITSVYIWWTIT